ncbi:nucleoplasmin-like protein isoform X2 [Diorhabda carinulata]|uniref:nucleoplasmin-like protein isoform X1 n=1 Tax=Diorhabda sublineata TaxID=1163346 RepID=UPI0024E14D83|nr:nucleoplasmin-like protein isoform X1 [Diorhabda sublineata]XP_057669193.1 nucleoplasmin-like protein isoform X2 [Diorhabda carinulata]
MADEYFFALTLKGKTSEVWDPEAKGAEDYQGGHKLIIKQALLGPEATEGEVNVVQVEAMTWKDSVKIPVATLKAGGPNSQVLLDLSFPDPPVTFSLIQGNGPVHIIGHHLIGSPMEEFDEMDELEEEMLDDEEGEEGAEDGRKRKVSNGKVKEEDEEEDEPKSKKAKATNAKGKTPVKNNAKAAKK